MNTQYTITLDDNGIIISDHTGDLYEVTKNKDGQYITYDINGYKVARVKGMPKGLLTLIDHVQGFNIVPF